MSADADGSEVNRAKLYHRGPIKCGSVERRRTLEQVGLEDRVEFVGDAKKAGRQAEEGDHLEAEADDHLEAEADDDEEDLDPYEEAYLNE